MLQKYITIEGNIGVGKTSLAEKIAEKYQYKLVLEAFADNPFIAQFYENPEKYAFPFELFFVAERFQQLQQMLAQTDIFYNGVITDYLFVKSQLFSKVNLTTDEYKLFLRVFDIIYQQLPKPDLIVYLHANTTRLLQNIKKRQRAYEQNIATEYLENIEQQYFQYFKQISNQKILIIDVNNIDFVNNAADFSKIENLMNLSFEEDIKFVTL